MLIKNSNDTIGNRTRDLPASSALTKHSPQHPVLKHPHPTSWCHIYLSLCRILSIDTILTFWPVYSNLQCILTFKSLAVSLRTARFNIKKFYMVRFVLIVYYGSENRQRLLLYTALIDWLVFITVVESVYSAVRTDSLYKGDYVWSFESLNYAIKKVIFEFNP